MKKSFTLIELIVVIAIIAILAATIAPNAFKAIEKAKISKIIATVKNLKTASNMYYADTGEFAEEYFIELVTWPGSEFRQLSQEQATVVGWNGPYIEKTLSRNDYPYKHSISVYGDRITFAIDGVPGPSKALAAGGNSPSGFDLDQDGVTETTGTGNYVLMTEVPENVAKKINDIIDGSQGTGDEWKGRGQVEWLPNIWVGYDEGLPVYLTGGY